MATKAAGPQEVLEPTKAWNGILRQENFFLSYYVNLTKISLSQKMHAVVTSEVLSIVQCEKAVQNDWKDEQSNA